MKSRERRIKELERKTGTTDMGDVTISVTPEGGTWYGEDGHVLNEREKIEAAEAVRNINIELGVVA